MPWVIYATAEVQLEEPGHPYLEGKDYELVPEWAYLSQVEFETEEEIEDRKWVVRHYLQKKAHYAAELAALQSVFNSEKRRLTSQQACLDWRYLEEVEFLAGELLSEQGGKKKSVKQSFGTVGWRKDTKIVVSKDREQELVNWLEDNGYHCAVKIEKSVYKKHLPEVEALPGVTFPSGQVFFARPAK